MRAVKSVFGKSSRPEDGKPLAVTSVPASLPRGSLDPPAEEEIVLHKDASDDGGLACNNEELLKQQREAIGQWIKSMGKRLMTGSLNLINTPFPVVMFEPRSYLEKLADVWVYPKFLSQAAASPDPVERMKCVVTWFVAGLHHGFEKWKKPFNPILGETWQARLTDGTTMFMEQISHHPPVSAFHMQGPGNSYQFRGLSQPTVSLMLKYYGFRTVAKGYRYVEFPDGSRIDIHYPGYVIKNVVYSGRPRAEVEGTAIFLDVKNSLKATLVFGAVKNARSRVLRRSDSVKGAIYDTRGTEPLSIASEEPSIGVATATGEDSGSGDSDGFESASENEWEGGPPVDGTDGGLEAVAAAAAVAAGAVSPGAAGQLRHSGMSRFAAGTDAGVQGAESADARSGAATPTVTSTSDGSGHAASSGVAAVNHTISGLESSGASVGSGGGSGRGGSGGFFGKMLGSIRGSATAPTTPEESQGQVLVNIEGSWLAHLDMNGKRYWSLAKEQPDHWQPLPHSLPSDTQKREDLQVLLTGDVKGAQVVKERLENLQRADKKLRETAGGVKH